MVDTGTDFRSQALRANIRRVDAVIFTHSHTDHIMGFDDLRRFSWERGSMPVYAAADTMADLERVFRFAFTGENSSPGYLKPEPHIVDRAFELGSTTITPLPVPHGNATVNGYLFSRGGERLVAYLSDCSGVPAKVAEQIAGVRTLIIDALRPKPHPTHLSVDQAIAIAQRIQPNETYFTHIAHELAQSFESQLPPHVHMAYDGLQLSF